MLDSRVDYTSHSRLCRCDIVCWPGTCSCWQRVSNVDCLRDVVAKQGRKLIWPRVSVHCRRHITFSSDGGRLHLLQHLLHELFPSLARRPCILPPPLMKDYMFACRTSRRTSGTMGLNRLCWTRALARYQRLPSLWPITFYFLHFSSYL